MIWMGLLAATVLAGLLWALRGFGRQGLLIALSANADDSWRISLYVLVLRCL
jgi:hypothetical protein